MPESEQKALVVPEITTGFARENDDNEGANHIYGLTVSFCYTSSNNLKVEEIWNELRHLLNHLPSVFTKAEQWGREQIFKKSELAKIRKLANEALVEGGYPVSKSKKPIDIEEYPEHFQELL